MSGLLSVTRISTLQPGSLIDLVDSPGSAACPEAAMGESIEVRDVEKSRAPAGFTRDRLDRVPWVEPIRPADADDRQQPLLAGDRGVGPYFRLLTRNP